MLKGRGKNGQPVHGTAALLTNIRKKGGWHKVVQEIALEAGQAAALAAVKKYQDVSQMPEHTTGMPATGKNKPTRH